jgi:hypothetical protein
MSALYTMRYAGQTGLSAGAGVLYIGRNVVVGVDVGDNRYKGSYTEESERIRVELTLSVVADNSQVTGVTLNRGQTLPISADLPLDFANGTAHQIRVAGNPVSVVFEKIGDIP